jgi:diketogulonate reductase-like aldo/keto reductase
MTTCRSARICQACTTLSATAVPIQAALRPHRERIGENAQVFDFALSDEAMAERDALDQTNGTDRALERKWW